MPRIIMHLDMDSYFASVEQQAHPNLRGLPIGITGKPIEKTIIVTASREGKKFGLKAGMPVWEAKKLCPQLVLFPGDGSKYVYHAAVYRHSQALYADDRGFQH